MFFVHCLQALKRRNIRLDFDDGDDKITHVDLFEPQTASQLPHVVRLKDSSFHSSGLRAAVASRW